MNFKNAYALISGIFFYVMLMLAFIDSSNDPTISILICVAFVNLIVAVIVWNYEPKVDKTLIKFVHHNRPAIGVIYNTYPENPSEGIDVVGGFHTDNGATFQLNLSEIKSYKFARIK